MLRAMNMMVTVTIRNVFDVLNPVISFYNSKYITTQFF